MMNDHNKTFMREAIALSWDNVRNHRGGPFGAVIVKDGNVIGRGANRVTSAHDPTAHAMPKSRRYATLVATSAISA